MPDRPRPRCLRPRRSRSRLPPRRSPRRQSLGEISCIDRPGPVALGSAQWNGWGRDIENTRYQPEPAIRATDVSKLALKWAFGYPGSSASGQPTIVDGRVFVAAPTGRVYSLDAKTGCTYWTYDAQAGVRTAISIGELAAPRRCPSPKKSKRGRTQTAHLDVQKAPSAAFFGDDKGAVYALDAQSGTLLWKTQVDAHPMARIQASPTVYHDRLVCRCRLERAGRRAGRRATRAAPFAAALRRSISPPAASLWRSYTVTDVPRAYRTSDAGVQLFGPAGAPIKGAPAIDAARGVVYVATGAPVNRDRGSRCPTRSLRSIWSTEKSAGPSIWRQGGGEPRMHSTRSPILRTLASGKQVILAGTKVRCSLQSRSGSGRRSPVADEGLRVQCRRRHRMGRRRGSPQSLCRAFRAHRGTRGPVGRSGWRST